MVAVLRALRDPDEVKVLVLDEVTARLPPHEVSEILAVIRTLRQGGVIFVSHRMEEVFGICDTVTVLRSGHVVADLVSKDTDEQTLVELLTGRPLTELYPEIALPQSQSILLARGLTGGAIHDLDLEVRAGELVGIASLDAFEATSVLALIFGLEARRSGELRLCGETVGPHWGPADLTKRGMTLVTDRLGSSLPSFTVRENLTTIRLRDVFGHWWLSSRAEKKLASQLIRAFGIVPENTESIFELLSGGNQQKVVLARSMRLRPCLLLLDDPTRGVDVGSKTVIYDLVRGAAEEGLGVLLASTDFEEMASICHRVIILKDGRLNDVVAGAELTPSRLLEGCYAARRPEQRLITTRNSSTVPAS
jgi:ribose transport system ATP-binding protein